MRITMRRSLLDRLVIFVVCVCTQIPEIFSLRDVSVSMPSAVEKDEKVRMTCKYNLEGEILYTLKWYKGETEFFRYTPKENPSTKYFPMEAYPELDVIKEESYGDQVTIRRATLNLAGQYICEVTTDIPSLHAGSGQAELRVTVLPTGPQSLPTIKGHKPKVKEGEWIKLTCTSAKSIPAANLTWTINNMPITIAKHEPPEFSKRIVGANDLEESKSTLTFLVTDKLFSGNNNSLKIRCTASVYSIHQRTCEISILPDKPHKAIFNPESRANPYFIIPDISHFNVKVSRSDKHNIDNVLEAENLSNNEKGKSVISKASIYVIPMAAIVRLLSC